MGRGDVGVRSAGRPACRLGVLCCLVASLTEAASAGEGFAVSGAGGSLFGLDSFQGVIYAPFSGLSSSGPQARAWAKTFSFGYRTDLPGRANVEIDAMGYGVEGEIGWQLAGVHGRVAGFLGAAWRDHVLSPPDPGSDLDRGRVGLTLAVDADWTAATNYGVMANARYLTSFEQYWAQIRPYHDLGGGWKVGPELAIFGGPGYDNVRAGVFTSGYELSWISWRRTFLGGSLGVQLEPGGRKLTPYVGLHSGFLF